MKSLNLYFASVMALISFVTARKVYQCTEDKTIALTFDDGPFQYTSQLVDYLASNDAKATFFTVGKFHFPFAVESPEYQNAMKKAHDNGFQIASHTFDHKMYNDTNLLRQTMTNQDNFIEQVTGDRPKYFRAPKGNCEKECQETIESWGYRLIQWSVDTYDYEIETSSSPQIKTEETINILRAAFAEERDNYLILMHDTENITVSNIVPWIIEESGMKEKGYRFVTVAECLGEKDSMYVSGKTYGGKYITHNLTSGVKATHKLSIVSYIIASLVLLLLFF
ncbi:carbohydrate esterase family 4 protein [Piromyces sp. E2]|nr:carbohydrate esterase family 4 protein [Piromyces sp. E2]|eukprot:OUM66162.1 carbohydrate esterase family 4 protein [Piromyces sp. E2]